MSERDLTPEEVVANVTKAEAEARKADAEARKADAEARGAAAAAEAAEAQLVKARNDAAREAEKRTEELAADKFHHVYLFDSEVSESAVKKATQQLATWERTATGPLTIDIVLNSPGGSVVDGFALIDFIIGMQGRGHVVNTTAYGMAASMAGVILQAGNTRAMGSNAVLLIHEAQFAAIGCPAPDTRVLTADLRWVPAGDLVPGDRLLAFDEGRTAGTRRRRWRIAEVEATGRAHLPSSRVTLEDGRVITVSDNHPWLVSRPTSALSGQNSLTSWRETRDLFEYPGVGNRRGLKRTRLVDVAPVVEQDNSYEAGYIGGLLDGEGSLGSADSRISFAQKPGIVLDAFTAWMDANGYVLKDYGGDRGNDCRHVRIAPAYRGGGIQGTLGLLMRVRPERLIPKIALRLDGMTFYQRQAIGIESVEPIGVAEVVTLKTSTGTFIGEGVAMHNSYGEIQDRVKLVDIFHERILKLFTDRSKVAKSFIKRNWTRKDWWLDSSTSLKHGFVDKVV